MSWVVGVCKSRGYKRLQAIPQKVSFNIQNNVKPSSVLLITTNADFVQWSGF